MSNVRVVKGTALYTAAFTPPTQLLNVTNTSLLTCNSPAIIDQSNNAFAITTNGDARVSTLTPFTAYVPYNPALGASTPGVWTLDEAMQAAATRQWNMYDPYFQNTTLLLHGNGTNAAQNNTFLDSSTNNFTITRNGNTTQGSFSPFSQTGWSNNFGGSQSINAPASTDFQFSGDFTIEMWAYTPSTTDASIFVQQSSTNYFALNVTAGTNINVYLNNPSANFTVTDRVPATNTWNHIALVRSGSGSGNLKIYLNGIASSTTATNTSTLGYNAAFYIGALGTQSGGSFNGYISNLRVVSGTALYTSNFTPSPIPLTAVTNTKLLTCQSNAFIDTNTQVTAKTITVNGTPSVQAFSPFYPTAAYTPQTIGGSGYFDGTGDFLSLASNATFNTSNGDFTFDAWAYQTVRNTNSCTLFSLRASDDGSFADPGINSDGKLQCWNLSGAFGTASTASVPLNAWTHVAFVRSSNVLYYYINGVQCGSTAMTNTWSGTSPKIGGQSWNSAFMFSGYLSNARFIKSAVYAGNFSIPTSPFTASMAANPFGGSNTAAATALILFNFTNAGIVDSTAKNVLETVGNAQISTTQSKFGGSSMYFDGTGDYLPFRITDLNKFGNADFTMEFWLYRNNSSDAGIYSDRSASGSPDYSGFCVFIWSNKVALLGSSGGGIWQLNTVATLSGNNVPTTTWTHIAITRSGTTFRVFIDGTLSYSATFSGSLVQSQSIAYIGADIFDSKYLNGYIDDFRITKGVARYTAAFTLQTSQWQDQ